MIFYFFFSLLQFDWFVPLKREANFFLSIFEFLSHYLLRTVRICLLMLEFTQFRIETIGTSHTELRLAMFINFLYK